MGSVCVEKVVYTNSLPIGYEGWKKRGFLEQAVDLPGFGVDVHIKVPRCGGQTRDRLDVGSQSVAGYTLAQFSTVKETT